MSSFKQHIEQPEVVLVGSGIMSATLGAMLKRLDPARRIQLFETHEELAQEASSAWNNAGTGHAGICELSYTPHAEADGTVDVSNAVDIFEQFELSRQFWAYAVREGMIGDPRDCISAVPHVSFVWGDEQVAFLRARHQAMAAHHFFAEMKYSEDPQTIREWAPLLMEGRAEMPVAATRMKQGTDVNFGALARNLATWLSNQDGCGVATGCQVVGLSRTDAGWRITTKERATGQRRTVEASFVFLGAGGATLPLLQKSGIAEAVGYGGFPVGGQWLVCEKPEIVARHDAKVYGQAQAEAPTMAVPHLDRRVIDGKQALLFGPFAAWTSRFLQHSGSATDLPGSVRLSNLVTLARTGLANLPLVRYLVKEGLQTKEKRVRLLRDFYPHANSDDWFVKRAGIRVQAVKDTAGIVHYGTEVVTDERRSLSALLGASPGASVSAAIIVDVLRAALPDVLVSGAAELAQMMPTLGVDLKDPVQADFFHEVSRSASDALQL